MEVGLCAVCRHAEIVQGAQSRFWFCGRSRTELEFPRYPRLPVRECSGYEPGPPESSAQPGQE